jgi:hypothetical protein
MLGCENLDPLQREEKLEIERLLGPVRPVIVKGGDALCGRDEFRRAFLGHLGDEVEDRLSGLAIVPGWQRLRRLDDRGCEKCGADQYRREIGLLWIGVHDEPSVGNMDRQAKRCPAQTSARPQQYSLQERFARIIL